jgi:predicted GIY-YIG superfamily endonuclease
MRTLEGALTENQNRNDIEETIPFWEFIDIEFNIESREVHLTGHYTQKALFPELFKRLANSAPVRAIQEEIAGKKSSRIQKLGWKPREQFKKEISAVNVIYTLIDTSNKLIYIGEAVDLVRRFNAGHKEIPNWDFYKFNLLPQELAEHRLTIERMSIRDMAALLENKSEIGTFSISDYKLANKRIDA